MPTLLKDLPKTDLPRERLLLYGSESLSTEELLSILFRTGTKGMSVKDLSNQVLSSCKNIEDLKNMTYRSLMKIKGLGPTKAITLLASLELGKRIFESSPTTQKIKVNNACDAYSKFSKLISYKKQENFLAIFLDKRKNYISHKIIFIGTVDSSLVHPRELFKNAILESASSIIIMHNHPSGEVTPSKHDDYTTKLMADVGNMMGIVLLDHIIVSPTSYYSYLEEGRIKYEDH